MSCRAGGGMLTRARRQFQGHLDGANFCAFTPVFEYREGLRFEPSRDVAHNC